MAKVLHIDDYRFDINEEPCGNCPDQKRCNETCEKAARWFKALARRLKGCRID